MTDLAKLHSLHSAILELRPNVKLPNGFPKDPLNEITDEKEEWLVMFFY